MSNEGKVLIVFAWAIEIVGVTAGVINSGYTTFGSDLPTTFWGYVPAIPMIVLAVAELGRVPLASVIFHKHKIMQGMAALGIVALGYLAVENWTFGFERIVDLRLQTVNAAKDELSRERDNLTALTERRGQMSTTNQDKREELRRGITQRDDSIRALAAQLEKEAEVHQRNLKGISEACRLIKERCILPRSNAEDGRYRKEVGRLNDELANQHNERRQFQSQIDGLVSRDGSDVAEQDKKVDIAKARVTEAEKNWHNAIKGNQIYRLAASFYGVNTSEVTEAQFANARWVFSIFSALAVSLTGSVAALVYYSRSRPSGAPSVMDRLSARVARARRAYYARKRKPLKVEVLGPERVVYREGKEPPIVIEKDKEVVRWIDRIVLIPRWGIKSPFYVNSLVNQRALEDQPEIASRVTPLKKVN